MNIQLDEALLEFRRRIVGTQVRRQKVEGVELVIDDLGNAPHVFRYLLHVHFARPERPANEQSEMHRTSIAAALICNEDPATTITTIINTNHWPIDEDQLLRNRGMQMVTCRRMAKYRNGTPNHYVLNDGMDDSESSQIIVSYMAQSRKHLERMPIA
ncbi:MAG TPA: hypothetical protein DCE55_29335 [Planctomycetaceae bacterium]|nr:hypothetical protein [Planctomycetaceae bacterium]|tara:strand:- start:8218 stop:8688 length:471 start_codon:yes stop_codon:yes gene_type:complete